MNMHYELLHAEGGATRIKGWVNIVRGKSNANSFHSSSHGAGRVMSRVLGNGNAASSEAAIFIRQALSFQPVRKIHHTAARQAARKPMIAAKLTPILTSDTPKKLQRKPLIRYTTGLNKVMVCHTGGSILIE